MPQPPAHYREFVKRFPELGEAWLTARGAEDQGPLDERTRRLVKLGIAIASRQSGATHSAVRKARAAGLSAPEIEQVVALAATTVGFPAAVAAFGWVRETLAEKPEPRARGGKR